MNKVGVILNEKKELASFTDGIRVDVYEKSTSRWNKASEVKDCFRNKESVSHMHAFLNQLITELKDCRILIGTVITGIPYLELDKAGFMLCEAEKLSEELLSTVIGDYEKRMRESEESSMSPEEEYPCRPYRTEEAGRYELDLRKLQKVHPEISSKQALLPFIRESEFSMLTVYCDHIMPWLDGRLEAYGLTYKAKKLEQGGYKVEISCND